MIGLKLPRLFNRGPFIGVDIGLYSVRLAKLRMRKGQPEIIRLIKSNLVAEVNELDKDVLAAVLTEVFIQINYQGEPVTANLSGEQLVAKVISVPAMNDSELEVTMSFEAQGMLPYKATDWIIRHHVLEPTANNQGIMQVLLIAAPRQQVLLFHQVFEMAGIRLTAIDIPHFALWRVYGNRYLNTSDSYMIVNLNINSADLIVVRNTFVQHIRSITFSKEQLIDELEHYFEIYSVQQNNFPIKQIILTGDISNKSNLPLLIDKQFGLSAEFARPCLQTIEQTIAKDQELSEFSTAIGTALRGVRY